MRIFFLFFLFFTVLLASATKAQANISGSSEIKKEVTLVGPHEKNPDGWSLEIREKANTAKNTSYLTEEEKKVIYYVNLVRMNPKLFSETYFQDYKKRPGIKKDKYVTSLEKDLNNARPLPPLSPDETLYKMAKDHARETGKKGIVGHTGPKGNTFEKRAKAFLGDCDYASENCQYGYTDALDIVMDLLIDEGIADLGHRKNILSPKPSHIGVSLQPHKTFRWNCVMDFGSKKTIAKRAEKSL